MFGLDTIKIAICAALFTAVMGCGYAIYHGIQAAEAAKIELQQAKLVAAAQQAQDQRTIAALQTQASLAAAQAAKQAQLMEALHAAPSSTVCLATPAGRAFTQWLRNGSGFLVPAGKAAGQSMAVPAPAAASK